MQTTQTLAPETPQAIFRKDYQPPAFLIDTVDLQFDLGDEFATVRAKLAVRRNPDAEDAQAPLELAGEELETVEVRVDGKALQPPAYEATPDTLTIASVPDAFTLETEVRIKPQDNTELMGLYRSGAIYCTQCEPEGFRRITWFLDRPDVMARYTTTITADKAAYPALLSNGNLLETGDLPAGKHYAKWEDPFPKPSYLFALVAGNLGMIEDTFTTESGRDVTLRIYSDPGNEAKCHHAMYSLKQAMNWDEEQYGREYDLDLFMIVAVNAFNFGAMENKGLNIFNAKALLADPATATDADYERILAIVAHEYFHNWTGNRVTCRDWFQLSLKEGLTIFRDQNFSRDTTSDVIRRIEEVEIMRTNQFAEDAGPMAHPVRPDSYIEMNNFYTVTVYHKGAEVVGMYRTLLGGREAFRRGTDLYFERHDGQAVTCNDFRQAMIDANDADFGQFERWYSQGGTPIVRVTDEYNDKKDTYTLRFEQETQAAPGQATNEPFMIPVRMGLLGEAGNTMLCEGDFAPASVTECVLRFEERVQEFVFEGVRERPVPSLFREWSAPVKLEFDQSRADLALLWANDSDAFNRWDAGQRLGTEVLLDMVAAHQKGEAMTLDPVFVEAFGRILSDPPADKALFAESLRLPSEATLTEAMSEADPHAIHAARDAAREALAKQFQNEFQQYYQGSDSGEPYFFDAPSAARRRLRGVCLGYLSALDGASARARCLQQFRDADNMTDRLAALGILNQLGGAERGEALAEFEAQYKNDTLVMDKWFTLQATACLPSTLATVREMLTHPAYDAKNPNKIRSLVGAFGAANPVCFHATDGSGHQFLADQLLIIDKINPQVAARACAPFTRYKKYVAPIRESLRAQLQRMMDTGDLSKNLFEIVSKSLSS